VNGFGKATTSVRSQLAQFVDSFVSQQDSLTELPQSKKDDYDTYNLAVTPQIIEFANALAEHETTFTRFPAEHKTDIAFSEKQIAHARELLIQSPALATLRHQLCPKVIKDQDFWRVYFILLHNIQKRAEFRSASEEYQSASSTVENRASSSSVSSVHSLESFISLSKEERIARQQKKAKERREKKR